jgi:hypothetical protein
MFLTIQPELNLNQPFSSEAFRVFNQSLWITLQGMAGIFIAIVIFYAAILILGKTRDTRK